MLLQSLSSLKGLISLTFILLILTDTSFAYSTGGANPSPKNNDNNKSTTTGFNDKDTLSSPPSSFASVPRIPSIASTSESSTKQKQNLIKIDKGSSSNKLSSPQRPLAPPFPDGLNNGRLVTLPPSEHYLLDSNLSGNTLLLPPRDIQVWLPPGMSSSKLEINMTTFTQCSFSSIHPQKLSS